MEMTATKTADIIRPGAGRPLNVLGHSITVKLAQEMTDGEYYVFDVASPAGAGIPPHVHQKEDEVIYVLEGSYEVFLDGKVRQAAAGSVIHFPRYIPHGFTNVGQETGRTLWFVTPGSNFERFFEELAALPADGPPDMEKVAAIFGRYDIGLLPPN